jgi:acetyl/propionyl-CoA carboxylase alpha subunit
MARVLREYEVLGVVTNIGLNRAIMEHPAFVGGNFDTHFLEETPALPASSGPGEDEKIAAAVLSVMLHREREGRGPLPRNGTGNSAESQSRWAASRYRFFRE